MSKVNIRFSPQNKPDFINELRGEVNDYFEKNKISKYGNSSIVFKSAFMFLLYFTPFVLMLTGLVTSIPAILVCWIIMGLGMSGIGMVLMHDANHRTFSKRPGVNKFLGKSLYLLGGFPVTWRYQHNTLHHGFTNIEGQDEDINPVGILRFSPHKPLYKIHRYQQLYAWFFYFLMTLLWATTKDFKQLIRYEKEGVKLDTDKKYKSLMMDLIVSKILYYAIFLILPLIVLPIAWYWTLLFFFVMHFVSGFILTIIFQTAHVMPSSSYPMPDEKGKIENSWAIHQLMTTTDYAPKSRIFSWMIGGLNYQVEHHLFPNISHVHYKKVAPFVKKAAEKYGLPYHVQATFLHAVYEHYKMLKSLGRQYEAPAEIQPSARTYAENIG